MDANRFFKIGVGSLAIVVAVYIVYLMVTPLVVSYYVMNRADRMTDQVHEPNKKVYVLDGTVPILVQRTTMDEPSSEDPDEEEPESVYIDIDTGNSMVTVHTGMPKDSILKILGQPSSSNFGDRYHETCEYNLPGHKWVHLVFSDGKLKKVIQH